MKTTLIALILILSLSGCQSTPLAPSPSPTNQPRSFKVAILLPRAINADSWDQAGYDGAQLIKSQLGAEVAVAEAVPEADFEKILRQFANDGYDFIIGHGNQFVSSAEKVAADYPHINFAVSGKYAGNNTNLGGLSLREGEMSYLFGVIAALKSKTKHVGYIGSVETNVAQQEIIALFKRGIQATDSSVQVTVDYVGNFTDAENAKRLAQKQIDQGVDVIFPLAGSAVMDLYALAERAHVYTLGWIKDLHDRAPNGVLTSNVQDVAKMLLYGATLVKRGRWEGKQYKFGLAEGVQYLAPFYGLITPEEERKINAVKNDLLAGKIDTIP